ncbi:hypothetical protein F8388_014358 [Cannabis sativa]|uniref:Uncharacterized protein n=1 Tax=Cannabis sativa TaxID=3483 RepID=A0A7J6EJG1_CANSA|nr:hypothetical protein F8388_014358 [Cannabis sativa]
MLHLKNLYVGTTPGFYYACKAGLGLPVGWSPAFYLLFWFVSLFAVPISISKDLPDIEGDRKFGITTFPTEYGPETIAFICHGLVLLNYVGIMAAAIIWPQGEGFLVVVLAERKRGEWRRLFNSKVILLSHAFMAIWVVYQAWILEKSNYAAVRPKKQMPTSCYPLSFLGNLIEGLVGKDKLEVLKIAACIFTEEVVDGGGAMGASTREGSLEVVAELVACVRTMIVEKKNENLVAAI